MTELCCEPDFDYEKNQYVHATWCAGLPDESEEVVPMSDKECDVS